MQSLRHAYLPNDVTAVQVNVVWQVVALGGGWPSQSSSLAHSAEQSAGNVPTCKHRPPPHSRAGLEIVTSLSDVDTPRSQGAPTGAGDEQPAPANRSKNTQESIVRARMLVSGRCLQ